jgi:glycosyltransferase involved in cell wall biosynthesis
LYSLLHEPVVSIVIINWNYGRFVGDAIRSVKEQTYKKIECVVVDNGSTDGSPEIIKEAIGSDPKFTFVQLAENLGHLGAALYLLDRLTGDFVTFLDADDVLSPDYVAIHVQVHLASGVSTGFSSSNHFHINAEGAILTGGNMNLRSQLPHGESCILGHSQSPRVAAMSDSAFQNLSEATRFLSPSCDGWAWSQGSSNMFRRALLQRVRPSKLGPSVFGGVDGYFTPLLHAMTGALLINLPLSLYRIHGVNDYSTIAGIHGLRTGNKSGEIQSDKVLRLVFEFLISDIDRALEIVYPPRYWRLLDIVASNSRHVCWLWSAHGRPGTLIAHPGVKELLKANFVRLADAFGRQQVIEELGKRMGRKDVLDIVGPLSLRDFGTLLTMERHKLVLKVHHYIRIIYRLLSPRY